MIHEKPGFQSADGRNTSGHDDLSKTEGTGPMNRLPYDRDALAALCRRHGICRLSLFGSVLKGTDQPDSDIDRLVEFEAKSIPGLLSLAAIETELSGLMGE
ncbi:MAG: nucleotidyltransferase family protein [Stellaceae bacterium]